MNNQSFIDALEKKSTYDEFGRFLEEKARRENVPISVLFELTPLCNLSCRMCYVHLQPEQMDRPLLTAEEWKSLIDQAYQKGMLQASISGGECLTYPGFDEIYLHLLEKGVQTSVMTNGLLLNEERIAFFTRHRPAVIQVTLYGSNDDAYERVTGKRCFKEVIRNIENAVHAGLVLTISLTPNRFSGEDLLSILKLGKKMGLPVYINTSVFDPRPETGRSGGEFDVDPEMYARLWRLYGELFGGEKAEEIELYKLPAAGGPCHSTDEKGLLCGGGRSACVLDWKGIMHPCNQLPFSADPLKDGYDTAWKQINEYVRNYPRVAECKGCPYDRVCVRCAGRMLPYAEPGKQPLRLCEKTRYLVHRGVIGIPDCE